MVFSERIMWWCIPPVLPRPPGCFMCFLIRPCPTLTCPLFFLFFFNQVVIFAYRSRFLSLEIWRRVAQRGDGFCPWGFYQQKLLVFLISLAKWAYLNGLLLYHSGLLRLTSDPSRKLLFLFQSTIRSHQYTKKFNDVGITLSPIHQGPFQGQV